MLQELRAIYERHIAIEDHDVIPLAGRTFDQDTIAAIGRDMASRRGLKPGDARR